MDKNKAEDLLNDTFNNAFDLDTFSDFIKHLFYDFKFYSHDKQKRTFGNEYKDYVDELRSLGVYNNQKKLIEVFVVKLKRTRSLYHARTMQRNLIAQQLVKPERINRDAAIVAFYNEDPENWRLSFVKVHMELAKDENGNIKVFPGLTPAKRHSFLVGITEPNYTCKKQFWDLITLKDYNPNLEEIENVFSIENVTNDFFKEYKRLYLNLKDSLEDSISNDPIILQEFESKIIKTSDFAKKLMGQIVFIYFLQKKGWMGVEKDKEWGTGSKKFFKRLFEHKYCPYENFFNDILEPLFYKALSEKHEDDYCSKFNCRFPFLNGGLFDPINEYDWENTDIKLKDEIFREIIKTFDEYNFTVKEDEPLEKEVAIDPEMLGKVFEKLLEVEDRKSKGSFYTPREIVHYMCQESVINYLNQNLSIPQEDISNFIKLGDFTLESIIKEKEEIKKYKQAYSRPIIPNTIKTNLKTIDDLISNIKIADPAVGSGAFPVGMMNEIIKIKTIVSLLSGKEINNYDLKLKILKNNLYGVDIDSSAVDVTKLRFWLSLIVDEKDPNKIDPLPNLDNKIRCGNSLLNEFEGKKLFNDISIQSTLYESESEIMLRQYQSMKNKYMGTHNHEKKYELQEKLSDIEWEFIEASLTENGAPDAIKKLEEYKINKSKPFFIWELYFSEVFNRENPGFDIVIANPPYIGEDSNKDIFRPIAAGNLSDFYQGKMDIFYFFFHLALNIGRDDSQIAFITTNYYPTATGADKLRKDFKKRAIIRKLINFSELKIFESAKGQHNMITILSKGNDDNFIAENCESKRTGLADSNILMSILNWNDSETEYYSVTQSDLYDGENNYIRLMGTKNEESLLHQILDKIKDESDDLLGNICSVNQGVVSGCDQLTNKSRAKLKDTKNVDLKDGIYIFDLKNKRDLDVIKNFTTHEKKLLMPFFKNSEINRYWCNKTNQKFLLYLDKNTENLNDYPNIKSHLNNFREILDDRREVKEKKIKYFSLQWPRTKEIFEKPKICVPYRPDINLFAYNEVPWYCRSDCYVITEKNRDINLKYILGLLNSRLFYIWLYHRGKRKGRKLELFKTPLSEIPIKLSKEKEEIIVSLVNEILKITDDNNYLKNKENRSKVKELEEKINNEIFDMYNISKEEKEIILEFNADLFE